MRQSNTPLSLLLHKAFKQKQIFHGFQHYYKGSCPTDFQVCFSSDDHQRLHNQYVDKTVNQQAGQKSQKVPIPDALSYPFSAIGVIKKTSTSQHLCTAFLISRNIIMGPARLILQSGGLHDLMFYPANAKYGFRIKKIRCNEKYYLIPYNGYRQTDLRYDYAIFYLYDEPGKYFGWLGLRFVNDQIEVKNLFELSFRKDSNYLQFSPIDQTTDFKQGNNGQLGTPILNYQNSNLYVIGINNTKRVFFNYSYKSQFNSWFSQSHFELDLVGKLQGNRGCQELSVLLQYNQELNVARLDQNEIGAEGIRHLITVNWPNLAVMILDSNKINNKAVKLLSEAKWLRLRELYLETNNIGHLGAEYLSKGNWPNLTVLVLDDNKIGDKGAKNLAKSTLWPNLEALGVCDNLLGPQGIFCLIGCQNWPYMTGIQLKERELSKKVKQHIKSTIYLNKQNEQIKIHMA